MLHLIEHVPVFLNYDNIFANSAQWILRQASWVILAALIILGLRAWMNGSLMTLFGGIVVAGILFLFSGGVDGKGGEGILQGLSDAVKIIFAGG